MKHWAGLGAICVGSCVAFVSSAAAADVKPIGSFAFALSASSDAGAKPRVLLWCQGVTLLGVVLPDEAKGECGTSSPKRVLPRAILLRDGRCGADGSSVSFGFFLSRQAWLFDTGSRTPEARAALLLHRFEGSIAEGRLTGSLVQVDVSHPGYPFQKRNLDAESLPSEQLPFADEAAWRTGIGQTLCVAASEH